MKWSLLFECEECDNTVVGETNRGEWTEDGWSCVYLKGLSTRIPGPCEKCGHDWWMTKAMNPIGYLRVYGKPGRPRGKKKFRK